MYSTNNECFLTARVSSSLIYLASRNGPLSGLCVRFVFNPSVDFPFLGVLGLTRRRKKRVDFMKVKPELSNRTELSGWHKTIHKFMFIRWVFIFALSTKLSFNNLFHIGTCAYSHDDNLNLASPIVCQTNSRPFTWTPIIKLFITMNLWKLVNVLCE